MRSLAWLVPLFSVALLATACSSDAGSGDDDATPDSGAPPVALTYFHDVKPIMDARCVGCHVEGGIAPFPLTDYDFAFERRHDIRDMVTTRQMPPWLAAPGCTEYAPDRSLTDAQIQTIAAWVDEDAPRGDPSDEGPSLDTGPDLGLAAADVDLTLALPAPYTPVLEPDEYRCFVLDWPETAMRYAVGFRANPGNPQVVHHVIAFIAAPGRAADVEQLDAAEAGEGYTCFGGPRFDADGWLGSWAPGSPGSMFPPDTGIPIEPGSKIVLQLHYNTLAAGPQADRTSIDLALADSVAKEARIQPWTNWLWLGGDGMLIPAGDPDVTHSFEFDPTTVLSGGEPFTVYSIGFHQHQLGTGGRVEIRRADGATDCLIDVPRWDFHWQGNYGFAQPKVLNPGDRLYLECSWDNSAANQITVDGVPREPQDVTWGEGTTDEMCLTGFYLTR